MYNLSMNIFTYTHAYGLEKKITFANAFGFTFVLRMD